jgi:hypothetical protein
MAGDDKGSKVPPKKVIQLVKKEPSAQQSDADTLLTGALGRFSECIVLGWSNDGDLEVWSNGQLTDEAHMLYIMDLWKAHVMNTALGLEGD